LLTKLREEVNDTIKNSMTIYTIHNPLNSPGYINFAAAISFPICNSQKFILPNQFAKKEKKNGMCTGKNYACNVHSRQSGRVVTLNKNRRKERNENILK